jgi:hypothetical protein
MRIWTSELSKALVARKIAKFLVFANSLKLSREVGSVTPRFENLVANCAASSKYNLVFASQPPRWPPPLGRAPST